MTSLDWEINIENTSADVAGKYGNSVVISVFMRYCATCFENLNPTYYADVFSELMLIDEDD